MSTPIQVDSLAPFIHVTDVERSIAFYARLGYAVVNRIDDPQGKACWAFLKSGAAQLMLSRASGPIDASVQAVMFYHYCEDVRSLRAHLLAASLRDGGRYAGVPLDRAASDHTTVFQVTSPGWLPAGEMRLHDPDGYTVMVGQLK